jgi:hypothetical protein
MEPKNYGLDPQPIVLGDNWLAGTERSIGASLGEVVLKPDHNWRPFCPPGERQFNASIDVQGCVSWAWTNAIEIYLRFVFSILRNFSDRFLAVASGTKPTGNDPHVVAETLRLKGVPLEEEYPFTPDLTTWEKFYAAIPRLIYTIAVRFIAEFDFFHEYISATPAEIKRHLTFSPLPAAVCAWHKDANGLYYMPQGTRQNHYVVIVDYVDREYWWVYDSYDLEKDGEFFKKVRWDHPFILVKKFTLRRHVVREAWWQVFLKQLQALFAPPAPEPTPAPAPTPAPQPRPSRIRAWAKAIERQESSKPPKPTDVNVRLKNPGNLKYTPYTASLGGKLSKVPGLDGGTFCEFDTYEDGFNALCQFLTDAANNRLIPYKNRRTLLAFTTLYANIPATHAYVHNIAKEFGVSELIDISELL